MSRSVRIMGWGFLAIVVGNIFVAALQTGHLPDTHARAPELIFSVVQAAQAGVIEELVVLAFVVVTLRQAGRPWWEVTVVALVLRAAYHIYYGPGVVGIVIWAALFYWIYLRFREVLPLMLCHALWDAVAFLSRASGAVAAVGGLMVVGLWVTSVILWLVERNNPPAGYGAGHGAAVGRTGPAPAQYLPAQYLPAQYPAAQYRPAQHQPFQSPPPGWHPDPAGANRWRWWDGHRWTDYVSPH